MYERLLWTRRPRQETLDAAEELHVSLDVMPALAVEFISDETTIRTYMQHASQLVITSQHAVAALVGHNCVDILQKVPVFTLDGNTSTLVLGLGGTVVATASSAEELLHAHGHGFTEQTRYMSGEHVVQELDIPRLVVYRTILTYPVARGVAASAIFSPMGAASVLNAANTGRLGILGAIGPTTATAMEALGAAPDIICHHPNETQLLKQLVARLRSS